MLIFNEGVPGAGKSYDAVVNHIIPALRAGRAVFARLNGLDPEELAKHTGRTPDEVRELLTHIPTAEVKASFVAERDEAGEFTIPERFRNALIVIDEVHEFYVASREPLPDAVEQFFAIHRHYGMDVLVLTQWYKRLHTAIRARIERKVVFQKLTAVSMENHYRVTYWATVAPDRYEKTGGDTFKYKPEFFPCYKGVADGGVNTEVYKGGSKSVWRTLAIPTAIMAVLLGVSVWVLWGFFSDGNGMIREPEKAASAPAPINNADKPAHVYQPKDGQPVAATGVPKPPPKPDPIEKMTPEQAYIWRIAKTARARAAARIGEGSDVWGLIEFREKSQPPMESISTRDLEAMGIEVEVKPYGFVLKANGEAIVATAWPTNEVVRPNHHELYRLDDPTKAGRHADASNASVAMPAAPRVQSINSDDLFQTGYGAFRGQGAAVGN